MAADGRGATSVDCTECPFSLTVAPEDDRVPAEVVIEHGKQTGHLLRVGSSEE